MWVRFRSKKATVQFKTVFADQAKGLTYKKKKKEKEKKAMQSELMSSGLRCKNITPKSAQVFQ